MREICEFLVNYGVELNLWDINGEILLYFVVKDGNIVVIEWFFE